MEPLVPSRTRRLVFATVVERDIKLLAPRGGTREGGGKKKEKGVDRGDWDLAAVSRGERSRAGAGSVRPKIGLQPCHDFGYNEDLMVLVTDHGVQEYDVALLEAHGSYFAYAPTLEALKNIHEGSLPFSEEICGGGKRGGGGFGNKRMPAYIQENTL